MIRFGDFMKTLDEMQVVCAMNECSTWLFYDSKERYRDEHKDMIISNIRMIDGEIDITLKEVGESNNKEKINGGCCCS